jgi:hypothetical protein
MDRDRLATVGRPQGREGVFELRKRGDGLAAVGRGGRLCGGRCSIETSIIPSLKADLPAR